MTEGPYHDGMRRLQDARGTRALADRLTQLTVHVTAQQIFPNCPRYLHPMKLQRHDVHAPQQGHTPPDAEWKRYEIFRDVIPKD